MYLFGESFVALIMPDGRTEHIRSDSPIFEAVVDALKQNDLEKAQEIVSDFKKVETTLEELFGDLTKVPSGILRRAYILIQLGLPVTYLSKFWERLKRNPSEESRKSLYDFLESNCICIGQDGYFYAYKAMRRDFSSIHDPNFKYTLGVEKRIPRSSVDSDRNKACSTGLHVGTFSYAKSFRPTDGHVVLCKVDPADVVAVPYGEADKCRVCALTPVKVVESQAGPLGVVENSQIIPPDELKVGAAKFKRCRCDSVSDWVRIKPSKWPKAIAALNPEAFYKGFDEYGNQYMKLIFDGISYCFERSK